MIPKRYVHSKVKRSLSEGWWNTIKCSSIPASTKHTYELFSGEDDENRIGLVDSACFAQLYDHLMVYFNNTKALPSTMKYKLHPLDKQYEGEKKYFLALLKEYHMVGDCVSYIEEDGKILWVKLDRPWRYSMPQLYYILSNVRMANEFRTAVCFINKAHRVHGVHPLVSILIYHCNIDALSNHHWLAEFSTESDLNPLRMAYVAARLLLEKPRTKTIRELVKNGSSRPLFGCGALLKKMYGELKNNINVESMTFNPDMEPL